VPVPEQVTGAVYVDPVQDAAPHEVDEAACVQAPAPLQVPVLPQVVPVGQPPWRSPPPAGMFAHVPALPVTLQAWQVGQLGLPQQTPSTQLPLVHSLPPPQVAPAALRARHDPPVPVQ
jgi:hypothetical protein